MPKFEHFWVCSKGEKAIFVRITKTFDSPFIKKRNNRESKSTIITNDQMKILKEDPKMKEK
jgi:hypothetical protein